ncbi:MAG TPA: ABC transporter transmembrane domain-containing protein, partial [Candidatus Saccharimonadales bacterium]|nr:ABC transporter transmembrane domain-containing protein [Candidatus Saccharimonadales bacterium]
MEKDRSTDAASLRLFWEASRHARRSLILRSLLFPVGSIFLGTITPLFIGKILASLGHDSPSTTRYLWLFCGAALIGFVCNRMGFVNFLRYQAETMRYLQSKGMDALLKRSIGFHNNNVGGKLVSDALDLPNGYAQFINNLAASIIPF